MSGARILLVDDDPAILRAVRRALEGYDYSVRALEAGAGTVEAARKFRPDVILLDLVLPDTDGIALCAELRPQSDAPIIVLSAVGDDAKKVQALDAGADDYVTKPFSMDELLARVRVALRRQGNRPVDAALVAGPIRLDLGARLVTVEGQTVHLTPREFDLLRLLLQQQGRVLTQRFILAQVWGGGYAEDAHVLRTFVHQLRQKLAAASEQAAVMVATDPGVGYRLDLPRV
jgi:two-component system, OmpR family, KDP operon response regulator KdpE